MIKIIFFDIDGTLRDFATGRIPESAKQAIRMAKDAGIIVAIATGRHLLEMQEEDLLENLSFDAYVTMNGQYCYNQSGTIFDAPLPREQVERLVKMVEEAPFPVIFLEKNAMYVNMVNEALEKEQESIKTAMPPLRPLRDALKAPVYQCIPCLPDDARVAELAARLDACQIIRWSAGPSFDVINKDISKQVGIQKVLEHYGLTREECAAIGDGENDKTMLSYVGYGIAMGNAKPELKPLADYVTGDIAEDGLLQAVEHILARNHETG